MATANVVPLSTPYAHPTSCGELLMTDQTDDEFDYQSLHSLSCQSMCSAREAATVLDRRPTDMPRALTAGLDRKPLR